MSFAKRLVVQVIIPLLIAGGFLLLRFSAVEQWWWQAIWLLGGLYLGIALLWFDEIYAHNWYQEDTQLGLVTRSVAFLLAYVPLALFLLSSSGSVFGMGVVLGLGIGIAVELCMLRNQPDLLHSRFLHQLKRTFKPSELHWLVWGFVGFIGVLSVALIR